MLFGLVISMEKYRPYFERLAEGCTSRKYFDDPTYIISQIYQSIALDVNDERIVIDIPSDAYDVNTIEDINPNDISCIRIDRNCE